MSTTPMAHIQVMGLHAKAPEVLMALRDLRAVQLDDISEMDITGLSTYQLTDRQRRDQARTSSELSRLEGMLGALGLEDAPLPDDRETIPVAEALEGVGTLLPQIRDINTRLGRLEDEQQLLPRYQRTLEGLIPLVPEGETIAAAVIASDAAVLDDLTARIEEELPNEVTFTTGEVDDQHTTLLISTSEGQRETLNRLITEADIARLRLPIDDPSESPEDALAQLAARQEVIAGKIVELENQRQQLAAAHRDDLLVWRAVLQQELDLFDTLSKLGQTERAFVLRGWVPQNRLSEVRTALPESAALEEIPIEDEERAPVMLANPTPVQPFEGLLSLLGRPQYLALDPTGLMAIFLPLFFGMMLGDIGYGLIVLGLMLFLRTRFEGMLRDIATVIAMGGAWAVVFGVIFGELFGTLGHAIGLEPILFDRADPAHVTDLLLLTLGVGAAHIVLGLIIGVWRGIQEGERHEVMETGGKLIGLAAALVLVAVLADYLPQALMTPSIAAIIVGIVVLGIAMGGRRAIISPIELVSTIGNVISYLRIAAIGLASVYLAVVANEIAGSIGTVVVGVIIAVLLHALNIVLGMFTPTIQSLRLHYVEFLGQFYDGGGRPYQPYEPLI